MVRTGWMDHERWTTDAKTKVMGIIGGKKKKDRPGRYYGTARGKKVSSPKPRSNATILYRARYYLFSKSLSCHQTLLGVIHTFVSMHDGSTDRQTKDPSTPDTKYYGFALEC